MNQKGNGVIIAIVAIIVIIGGWLVYSQTIGNNIKSESEAEMMVKEDQTNDGQPNEVMTNDQAPEDNGQMMDKTGGEYVTYSPELLSRAEKGRVVLFFRANWCPTCRVLHSKLQANISAIPKDLTILDVDYDNSSQLKQKYSITYQHTLVQVDAQGNQITKWSGGSDLASILDNLQ